jgi:hypothetical protein
MMYVLQNYSFELCFRVELLKFLPLVRTYVFVFSSSAF